MQSVTQRTLIVRRKRASAGSQKSKSIVAVPEHLVGVGFEPFIQQRRVDGAKIGRVAEVRFRRRKIEVGRAADEALVEFGAHDEEWRGGAVVGATTFVFGRSTTELGEGRCHHLVGETVSGQISLERGEATAEGFE